MATAFRLPDLGEGISEAEIVEWLVAEADQVVEHQPLVRVETDKAIVEVPSPVAGRVGRIRHRPGDLVHVGEVLVWILAPGETEEGAREGEPAPAGAAGPPRPSTTVVGTLEEKPIDLPPPGAARPSAERGDVLATPAVRRLARELGVAIEEVRGSGAGGRVTEADIREHASARARAAAPLPTAAQAVGEGETVERIALKGIRRAVARRLETAIAQAALTTHMDEIDATELLAQIARSEGPRSVFPWLVRATALCLRKHPRFNATLDDAHEEVLVKGRIHIGIAVDTPEGLMVPIVRDADRKHVAEIGSEVARLAAACRDRTIALEELRGATFSISNIGSLGGVYATPIPNYPEVAILATGRIGERLARAPDASILSRSFLPVSLSFDHRVLDGADAARFAGTLREILGRPEGM